MTSDTSGGVIEGVPAPAKSKAQGRSRGERGRRGGAEAAAAPVVAAEPAEDPDANLTEAQKASNAAKARDNAVTARLTKTKMCHFFERGKCASGDCRYAHSQAELRQQPNLEKTKLCKTYAQHGYCNDGENCGFAHGETELRVTEGIYKTQMCHFFERGRCLKGDRCNHAHGKEDLRMPQRTAVPFRKNQGASSGGESFGDGGSAAGATASMTPAPVGGNSGPIGLRSPLSPLPLAELLGDTAYPGNIANTPAPPLPGLHSPDFMNMSLWTGMPWTPPAFAAPLGQLNGLPMHSQNMGNPATPMAAYQQAFSPMAMPHHSMHYSAPPPGIGALGGMDLGVSPAPGLAPATVGVPEGVRGQREHEKASADTTIVVDLNTRLASLDVVVNSLASEVRDFTASGSSAAPAAGSERLVHRI